MTKEERALVVEIKAEIDALIRQYTLLAETRNLLVDEIRALRTENETLRKTGANGRCYFYQGGPMLPFKWRG